MRPLFFALLAANLLFLAWAQWIDTPRDTSGADAISRLPRLKLATEADPGRATPPMQPSGPPTSSDLTTAAGNTPAALQRRCMTVGPFNDMSHAARTAGVLIEHGLNPWQRATAGETVEGYWVFVAGLKTEDEIQAAVDKLTAAGFSDAHVMKPSPSGRRISVGLFTQRARAENRAEAVRRAGLETQIGERQFLGTVYWVDVTLGPNRANLPPEALIADIGQPVFGVGTCPIDSPLLLTGGPPVTKRPYLRRPDGANPSEGARIATADRGRADTVPVGDMRAER